MGFRIEDNTSRKVIYYDRLIDVVKRAILLEKYSQPGYLLAIFDHDRNQIIYQTNLISVRINLNFQNHLGCLSIKLIKTVELGGLNFSRIVISLIDETDENDWCKYGF